MIYTIKIRPKAQKFIEKQDASQRKRIYKAICDLPNGDTKKLAGHRNDYRLRVGNYRIIYTMDHNSLVILIIKINNRGQIYK